MPEEDNRKKKIPTPEHGYGLKIIRQIMSRFGDQQTLIEESATTYRITILLPYDPPKYSAVSSESY